MTIQPPADLDDALMNALAPLIGDKAFKAVDLAWNAMLSVGRIVDDIDHPGWPVLVIHLDEESAT